MNTIHRIALVLAALAIPTTDFSIAQAQGRGRRGPPSAAYEACAGKKAGDACSFECRRGHVEGKCHLRYDGRLSCVPRERGPRGPWGSQ